MAWNFGDVLLTMVAFFFWFTFIWMFIGAFADIFRREDLSGVAKVGWVLAIVILPFLGILIYLISRPNIPMADQAYAQHVESAPSYGAGYSAADEIAKAAELQRAGALTAEEFETLKRAALAK